MARITVEDCLEHVENRFKLVLLASRRARQLVRGVEPLVAWENDKPTVVALREIAENLVNEETMQEASSAMTEGEGTEFVEDELAALYSEISREMNQTGFGHDHKPEAAEEAGRFFRQGVGRTDEASTVETQDGQEAGPDSDSSAGLWNSSWQLLESQDPAPKVDSDSLSTDTDSPTEEEQGF